MRRTVRRIGFALAATFLALSAGCAASTGFVYRPDPPETGGRQLPVRLAVLPFGDGTESFTERGSTLRRDIRYNLAKVGVPGLLDTLPPEFWAKSFADELAASNRFESARFVYSPAELKGEGFVVDGTLKKAVFQAYWNHPHEILVSFRAARLSDRKVVWEKEFGKAWETATNVRDGCGPSAQCVISRFQGDWNREMAALFASARADLAATLAALPEGGARGRDAGGETSGRPAGESLERTIEQILKGK